MKICIELPNTNNLKLYFYYNLVDGQIQLNVSNDIKSLFISLAKYLSEKISSEPFTITDSNYVEPEFRENFNTTQIKTITLTYYLSTDKKQFKKLLINMYYNNWTSPIVEKVLTSEHLFILSQFSFDNLDMIVQNNK